MTTAANGFRTERDSLGEVQVPAAALYGAQTQRAVDNFPISGLRLPPGFIHAQATIKRAAAEVNMALDLLDERLGQAIVQAAQEVTGGRWDDQFVVDVYQAGAGTSQNMNANEVIANRAIELLGGQRGDYTIVHPNDHVNMAQSTNDTIPTAIRLASLEALRHLLPALRSLEQALSDKARDFDRIVKAGRTHLQDAVPIRLGQEFSGYAKALHLDIQRIEGAGERLKRLGIGGTAAGTGLNAHPEYHPRMVARLAQISGFDLRSSGNLVESMQSAADFLDLSAALRTLATTLIRIANDLRLLASGPMTGLDELRLPAVQPGSSIMPGKVNPSIPEMVNMVAFQVVGNDTTIMLAVQAGQLELNVMLPVIAHNLLQSVAILTSAARTFTERCVWHIEANEESCRRWLEGSLGVAAALNPYIGYAQAAQVAQEALRTGKSVRQVALEQGLLTPQEADEVFDPHAMTEPRLPKTRRRP